MSRKTKTIKIGKVSIGGNNPIAVQSMTKTFTRDAEATIKQIHALEKSGCQIIRCAVPTKEDALALTAIKKRISIPLVADIHFDYRLALIAVEAGVDKLRINPGNIGSKERIKAVVSAAKERGIPIRIGVNSGSLEKGLLAKYHGPTAESLVESALNEVTILEQLGFEDIVISVKATSVPTTIKAYQLLSQKCNYPLHVGVTEAGIPKLGTVKSAVGIGTLLAMGIGDTIRVSLTADPVEEVILAYEILKALELHKGGVTIISCPTCGRCEIEIKKIVEEIEKKTRHIKEPLTIAIMGCVVNGPGEAKEADLGIAAGKNSGLIFKNGKTVKKVSANKLVAELLKLIKE
ncbi:MAG: flavodoxin-dependent (E)-4-hydroxy-3-methylbut-2-enyl-diphosphate synthase [Candidatus Saganbacteria bacterium]|nr:flavodoxin-dependent (E)-4-hydroxy-3-methylbut-2-enyl-diphosphate synthase [Candidatus Saganbacteria bacterium]